MVITWKTKKVANGFEFKVITVEHGKPSQVLQSGVLPTRPRAVTQSKKWVRYLKAQQRKAA